MNGDYVLLTEEVRRARKLYRCVHCTERIEPGEEHVYIVGTYDGFISGDRWHRECRRAVLEKFLYPLDWSNWEPGAYERGSTALYYAFST
jgi:hypothetical protein